MAQGIARRLIIAAKKVHIEDVLPGTPAHGARLDLAEADVAQGENAERLEERSGHVFYLERDGSLVGAGRDQPLVAERGVSPSPCQLANQKKAGEVAFVVLDAGPENPARVFARSMASGDARGVAKPMSHDVLHTSRSVVERDRLDAGVVAKEVSALVERDRVREHLAQRVQLHSGRSDDVMNDAQQKLALHKYVASHQEVSVFSDGAGQRILDGDNGGSNRSALDPVEYFNGARTGYNHAVPQHALRSLVTERTEFALNGDFDRRWFHYMAR